MVGTPVLLVETERSTGPSVDWFGWARERFGWSTRRSRGRIRRGQRLKTREGARCDAERVREVGLRVRARSPPLPASGGRASGNRVETTRTLPRAIARDATLSDGVHTFAYKYLKETA